MNLLGLSCLGTQITAMTNANTDTSLAQPAHPELTQEWDKVFPGNENVEHRMVEFVNRYL